MTVSHPLERRADDLDVLATTPWPADASRDPLVGAWWLWQRRGGHRTSTDDLLTAWMASVEAPEGVPRLLDLGCGIGSVLLLSAHALRPGESVGVEAQAQSVLLARRSIAELPPGAPSIRVSHDDFRNVTEARYGVFPVVTGSPPYLPVGTGVPSPDPQRVACRFELRGGVEAYCGAASRVLSPDGVLALVFQTVWEARVLDAASASGLALRHRASFRMRTDRPAPFLSVYAFRRVPGAVRETSMSIRDTSGGWTPEYREVRRRLGLPAGDAER